MGMGDRVAADATNALLREVLETLGKLPDGLRQSLMEHQWASIPLYVDEYAFSDSLAVNTPLLVNPQTSGLEVITSVVAIVPAGATGVVQLGTQKIYVSPGVTTIAPVQKIMQTTDVRSLVIATTAGPAALWLTGQQLPTSGVLAR